MIARQTIELPADKYILLEALNSRVVRLTTNVNNITEFLTDNKISRLEIANEIIIDTEFYNKHNIFITIDNFVTEFNIKYISKISNHNYLLITEKQNVLSLLLTPVLYGIFNGFISYRDSYFSWNKYFINTYLIHKKKSNKYYIGLSYRYFPNDDFREIEYNLKKHPLYNYSIDNDYKTVMLVYNIPTRYMDDVNKIIEGRYSSISDSYKEVIIKFNQFTEDGLMYKILNKDENLRKQMSLNLGVDIPEDIDLYDKVGSNEIIQLDE